MGPISAASMMNCPIESLNIKTENLEKIVGSVSANKIISKLERSHSVSFKTINGEIWRANSKHCKRSANKKIVEIHLKKNSDGIESNLDESDEDECSSTEGDSSGGSSRSYSDDEEHSNLPIPNIICVIL